MERNTSTYERVMFFEARWRPAYFAFHMRITGVISADQLRKALKSARARYPLSAVRLASGPGNRQYITTDNVPDYPVVVLNKETEWKSFVAQELVKKFDDCCGPMVNFYMIQSQEETHIIPVFHHAICDGLSAVVFLKDMLVSLLEKSSFEARNEFEPILIECLRNDVKEDFEKSELPDWISHKLHLKIDMKPCPAKFHFLQPSFEIRTLEFDETQTSVLKEKAKEWGVSVHSFLGSIMLSTFASHFGRSLGHERIIQSPMDFRHFLDERAQNAFGLYMGIIKEKIDCGPGKSLKEIASQINAGFRTKINSTETLKGYYMFMNHMLTGVEDPEGFFYSSPKHDFMDYDFSLSNLGKLELPENHEHRILEFHGPMFSAVDGERIFGVNTANGKMTICMIYDNNCFCSKRAEGIFGEIENKLLNPAQL